MRKDKCMLMIKLLLLVAIIAFAIYTIIQTPSAYVENQPLQQIGTVVLMIPLLYGIGKNSMPMSAFLGISIAIIIHLIGAQYSYSYVPNVEWCNWLGLGDGRLACQKCGAWVGVTHEIASRNNFDRLVHFSFGALLFPFLLYLCRKCLGGKGFMAILFAWLLVQAGSIVYEIFEWQISVWMKKSLANGYNGQQGDVWDAQKDMALAMAGSTIMAIVYLIKDKWWMNGAMTTSDCRAS